MLTTLLAFLVALGVLVTFHEFGHYWVARRCGVKVLRFSIGFGTPLVTWRRGDTEWALAPIPLGGYVKMLDEREAAVPADQRHQAFNRQTVGKRMAIVVAGPVANLLLAVVLYAVVLMQGVTILLPGVGTVQSASPAAEAGFRAGEQIATLNGEPMESWTDLRLGLMEALAARETLVFGLADPAGKIRTIPAERLADLAPDPSGVAGIGLSPAKVFPIIGTVLPDSEAARRGLQVGDRLLTLAGQPIAQWDTFARTIHANPDRPLVLTIQRAGEPLTLTVTPAAIDTPSGKVGRLGLAPQTDARWLEQLKQDKHYSLFEALPAAVSKTYHTAASSLSMMGRMLLGQLSANQLSGPLMIADYAGQTARQGLVAYLEFMALISVSLGVLNLLPIPVLDGGHLLYYVVELCRGKPLSEHTLGIGQRIGFFVLVSLMAFALFNDIQRLVTG